MRAFQAIRSKAFAYLEMARPYTLFHAGTLALAAAEVATAGRLGLGRAALIWLTPMVGWLAGLATSDYHDRELDKVEKPQRPIPSGRVGEREAFWLMVGLIAAGFVGALLLGWRTFLLAWIVLLLGIGYARTFKARGFLGHFDRGALAAFTVLFGSLAASGEAPAPVWLLVLLFFCHDSGTNLLGAVRDVEGDREAGYQTVPVRYGVAAATAFAAALLAGWVAVAVAFAVRFGLSPLSLGLAALAVALDGAALLQMLRTQHYGLAVGEGGRPSPRRVAALAAHKVLVLERLVLSVAFIATATPAGPALGLLAALLLATWWAQRALRDRYEFAPVRSAGPAEEHVPGGGRHGPPRNKEESRGHAGTSARTA